MENIISSKESLKWSINENPLKYIKYFDGLLKEFVDFSFNTVCTLFLCPVNCKKVIKHQLLMLNPTCSAHGLNLISKFCYLRMLEQYAASSP